MLINFLYEVLRGFKSEFVLSFKEEKFSFILAMIF